MIAVVVDPSFSWRHTRVRVHVCTYVREREEREGGRERREVGGGRRRVGKQVAPKPQPWAVAVKYCGCFKNRSFLSPSPGRPSPSPGNLPPLRHAPHQPSPQENLPEDLPRDGNRAKGNSRKKETSLLHPLGFPTERNRASPSFSLSPPPFFHRKLNSSSQSARFIHSFLPSFLSSLSLYSRKKMERPSEREPFATLRSPIRQFKTRYIPIRRSIIRNYAGFSETEAPPPLFGEGGTY